MVFVTISIPLTQIGVKGIGTIKRGDSAMPSAPTSQDLDNVTITQDGTGKHQYKVGVEGKRNPY